MHFVSSTTLCKGVGRFNSSDVPSRHSTLKCSLRTRFRRASCTVWIVALLPEPWNANSVGFVLSLVSDMFGGVVPLVKYVGFDGSAVMGLVDT